MNKLNEIDYIKQITIENFDPTKLSPLRSSFITENSRDIPDNIILYALTYIDRATYIIKLSNLIYDIFVATSIEASIFEFSLIHATLNNIDRDFICAIYDDKFIDIFMNLDESSRLNNKTFRNSVLSGLINPKLIAFLSPEQTHPESWAVILNKANFRVNAENNMATTDIYKCYKCGERKSKVTELQLRGADEPATLFITCLSCYNTFLK